MKEYFAEKEKQARHLATLEDKPIADDIWTFFKAGRNGDWSRVNRLYAEMAQRSYQFDNTRPPDENLTRLAWQPLNESFRAYQQFSEGEPVYIEQFGREILKTIPTGSILFAGSDPARFVVSYLRNRQTSSHPIFVISQNQLVDGLGHQYLSATIGTNLYTPTDEDSAVAFDTYLRDVKERSMRNALKPGENYGEQNGRVQISGLGSVMEINALLAKVIVEKNPNREVYVHEGFPLDWMRPYLSPVGLLLRLHPKPVALDEPILQKDREYWTRTIAPMIGPWLTPETTVEEICTFARKTYITNDLSGFTGDSAFVRDLDPRREEARNFVGAPATFSGSRASIARLYGERASKSTDGQRANLIQEADFAFRQALALNPSQAEAVQGYVVQLVDQKRFADVRNVVTTARMFYPRDKGYQAEMGNLLKQIEEQDRKPQQ